MSSSESDLKVCPLCGGELTWTQIGQPDCRSCGWWSLEPGQRSESDLAHCEHCVPNCTYPHTVSCVECPGTESDLKPLSTTGAQWIECAESSGSLSVDPGAAASVVAKALESDLPSLRSCCGTPPTNHHEPGCTESELSACDDERCVCTQHDELDELRAEVARLQTRPASFAQGKALIDANLDAIIAEREALRAIGRRLLMCVAPYLSRVEPQSDQYEIDEALAAAKEAFQ